MTGNFNKLTPAETERLSCLSEECGEIIQVIGKVLRHGYEDHSPYDKLRTSNRVNLMHETGDFDAVAKRMLDAGDITAEPIRAASLAKHERLKRWTHHQDDSEAALGETK